MEHPKALGVRLNLLNIVEGRTNDILDTTCSLPEKLNHGGRFTAMAACDIENLNPFLFVEGFMLPLSFFVALDFERPGVDAQPEAVTEIECEGCLELLLCRLAVLLDVGFLFVFLPQLIEVFVNIVLGKVLGMTHDLDEVLDVLLVRSLGLRSFARKLRLPSGLLGRLLLRRHDHLGILAIAIYSLGFVFMTELLLTCDGLKVCMAGDTRIDDDVGLTDQARHLAGQIRDHGGQTGHSFPDLLSRSQHFLPIAAHGCLLLALVLQQEVLLGCQMPLGVGHISRGDADVTVPAVERRLLCDVPDTVPLQNGKACCPGAPFILNHA